MHEWRKPTIRSPLMHDYIVMEPNTYVQSGWLKSTAFRFDKWEVHFSPLRRFNLGPSQVLLRALLEETF